MYLDYKFYDCDYGKDFETLIDVHEFVEWVPEGEYDLWLKAYDTSLCETEHEAKLYDDGYKFECMVQIVKMETGNTIYHMGYLPVKSKWSAENRLFQASYELFEIEEVMDILKNLVDK
jgi:hypothetical protein